MTNTRPANDAFARRPSSDYGRRREPYGRSASDYYGAERYRDQERNRDRERDQDSKRDRSRDRDKDRARDYDRHRDSLSSPRDRDAFKERGPPGDAPRGPKTNPDLAFGRLRQERQDSASKCGNLYLVDRIPNPKSLDSSPISPAQATSVDGSNPAEAMGKVFRAWIEDTAQYSRYLIHKENLEKVIRVRELELSKATQKHLDFPSVPELHKKFISRDNIQLKEVDEMVKKHQHRAAKSATRMGQLLLMALPEIKKTIVKDADNSCQKGDLDAIREDLKQMKVQFANYQDASTREVAALQEQVRDLQGQLVRQDQQFKLEREEKESLRKRTGDGEAELIKLRAAFADEIGRLQQRLEEVKSQQVQGPDHSQEIGKLSKVNEELVAKNAELERKLGLFQEEKDGLQSRLSNLEAQVTPLEDKVEKTQGQSVELVEAVRLINGRATETLSALTNHADVLTELRHDMGENSQLLQQQGKKLQSLEQRFMDVDFPALEEISERWGFEWQDVKNAIQNVQEKLAKQPQPTPATETRAASVASAVPNDHPDSPVAVAELSKEEKEEIKAEVSKGVMVKVQTFTDALIAHISEMIDRMKATLKDTQNEMRGLDDRIKAIDSVQQLDERLKSLEDSREQLLKRLETFNSDKTEEIDSLKLQISVLDSQYNNLTTKEIAERILGHFEQLSPTPHQLTADITALDSKVQLMQKQLQEVTAFGSAYKGTVTKDFDGIDNVAKDWNRTAQKRRRLDSNANGVFQPVPNPGA